MDKMPLGVLKSHIESALKWASEVSELWTGTLYGDFIDREKSILKGFVETEEWDKAYDSMIELIHMCHEAERAYE